MGKNICVSIGSHSLIIAFILQTFCLPNTCMPCFHELVLILEEYSKLTCSHSNFLNERLHV